MATGRYVHRFDVDDQHSVHIYEGAIPKCRYAAVRLECFFVDGCVDISSPSSSAFNSARHAGGSQRR